MGLVDYSSSESDSSPQRPSKKLKSSTPPSSSHSQPQLTSRPSSTLPPLPSTFHDLYASTVRQSTTDDPTLHQGRRRQIPHVPGNWPSHLYIEWRPSSAQHSLLTSFLAELQSKVSQGVELNGFLTSDLGTPLPLHVSLSRPFVLSTGEKDAFLENVTDKINRTRIPPFRLRCEGGVKWHRTPESNRSFLVLRVRSSRVKEDDEQEDDAVSHNPELTTLLTRCNTAVAGYGQPQLYQWADNARVGDAFHVSIAWSFAEPDDELRAKTGDVFAKSEFGDAIREMGFEVDGVKAKIGNVVHHIPLARESAKRQRGLLGL